MMPTSSYRPDIDSLRAVAVAAVILYHAKFPGLSGGYIGVDVFFVISGYLITSIIKQEILNGYFSLFRFWERRIRRIIPPLVPVLGVSFVMSYFTLLVPVFFEDFAESVIAQGGFLANIYFMRKAGYFAAATETQPLQHLWSLGVEEQFYVIFPLLFIILATKRNFRRQIVTTGIILILLASFGLCAWLTLADPNGKFHVPGLPDVWGQADNQAAAFYLLPTRAWELCTGALLAVTAFRSPSRAWSEGISLLGLLGIAIAIFMYSRTTPFPGVAAALPVFGTAAVIFGNTSHSTWTSWCLSWKPFVFIGLISYGLYLWHWPVLVFAEAFTPVAGQPLPASGLILVSGVLAWVSYAFLETPIRRKEWLRRPAGAFAVAFVSMLAFIVAGAVVDRAKGLPERLTAQNQMLTDWRKPTKNVTAGCLNRPLQSLMADGPCLLGATDKPGGPDFLVWGDSHAHVLGPAFHHLAKARGLKAAIVANAVCPPLFDAEAAISRSRCASKNAWLAKYAERHAISTVFLAANWLLYIDEQDGRGGAYFAPVAAADGTAELTAKAAAFRQRLKATIDTLKWVDEVTLVRKVPKIDSPQTRLNRAAVRSQFGFAASPQVAVPARKVDSKQESANRIIDSLTSRANVNAVDPKSQLCTPRGDRKKTCHLIQNDTILYKDNNHLSPKGSVFVADIFQPVVPNAEPSAR